VSLDVYGAIAAKRDGEELPAATIRELVEGFMSGEVADYQMSALLMAIVIRGMEPAETRSLTKAVVDSGARLDLSGLGTVVDKHSTGGVGDKTTLVVAPLVAACSVVVAKTSGRGLGHTGGTIDKLESIPGFRTDLSSSEFVAQARRIGIAVSGQSADLVPADKRLYALRDVTATIESVPLISASIVAKKVAGGANAVVYDVKAGAGAFMPGLQEAQALGRSLLSLSRELGLEARAVVSSMEQPLGRAVGNALEVAEAVDVLKGRGPEDVKELSLTLAAHMVSAAGAPLEEARERVAAALASGEALERFRQWTRAQGGDDRVADDPEAVLPRAPWSRDVAPPGEGWVARLDAREIGRVAMALGAGRNKIEDAVDPAVGVVCEKKVGERVWKGDRLFTVHARDEEGTRKAIELLAATVTLADKPVEAPPLILLDPLEG
jgi:pyrimidine-nucleoside phosphorylase